VRVLHLVLYVDASRRGQASLSAITGFAVTVTIGMALLLAGSFAGEGLRIPLWVAAAAIDYAGPAWLTRDRLRELQQVAVAHFAERYSLFVIICLGESIVAIGIGASAGGQSLSAASVTAVTLALLIAIGLWWTYFDRFATVAEERLRDHHDPVIAAADAYSYLHLAVVAGIIIFAVGARAATAHATAHLSVGARLAMCGGVATYLLAHAAFLLRMVRRIHPGELVAAGLALVVFAFSGGLPGWAAAGVLTIDLALLVGYEMIRAAKIARR
jgi:low temperature requirement protein LtrA